MNLFADGSEWFPLHGLSFNWFGFGSPLCLALFISLSFYNKLSFFRPASPPSMETHEIRQRKCRLCCPFSQEAKIIAKTVYRKIQRSAKGQNRWGNNFEEGLLAGLEKQVAPLGTTKHKPDGPCTHLPLQMALRQQGLTLGEINSFCLHERRNMAEREYHLWLVETQIRRVAESLSDQKERKERIKSGERELEEERELRRRRERVVPLMAASSPTNGQSREQDVGASMSPVALTHPTPILQAVPFLLLIPFLCATQP